MPECSGPLGFTQHTHWYSLSVSPTRRDCFHPAHTSTLRISGSRGTKKTTNKRQYNYTVTAT